MPYHKHFFRLQSVHCRALDEKLYIFKCSVCGLQYTQYAREFHSSRYDWFKIVDLFEQNLISKASYLAMLEN